MVVGFKILFKEAEWSRVGKIGRGTLWERDISATCALVVVVTEK